MDDERVDVFDLVFPTDEGTPTATETATEAAAPEGETSLGHEGSEQPVTESVAEPVAVEASPEPEPIQPAPVDWNHPELAALRAQAEQDRVKAERIDAIDAQLAQLKRQKQATQFQSQLAELADGDPERLQQLNGVIAQVATPAVQQWQAAEQQANATAKALAAMWIAAQANLSEEQVALLKTETDALMAVEGPDLMQQTAFGKRDFMRQNQAAIQERDRRIAELEQQLAAGSQLAQREANGADAVDSGQGGLAGNLSREERMRNAEDMGGYMDALVGRVA